MNLNDIAGYFREFVRVKSNEIGGFFLIRWPDEGVDTGALLLLGVICMKMPKS